MSVTSPLAALSAGISPTALATEPESIRRGGEAAQQAYETGLGFESMLMNELSQQLTSTISGDGSDSDGLGASSDSGDDSSSDGSSVGGYSSLLSSALTQGVMSGTDNGLAMQIAQGIDPKLAWGQR